ncbi:MAG: hypothetical protein AAFO63_02715 [Pseudomonadota bacterium]
MYDARGPGGMSNKNSNLLFGGATIVIIAIAFFGVLFFPGGTSGPAVIAKNVSSADHPILTKLDDPKTKQYIEKLQVAAPESAKLLAASAKEAVARNAGETELIMLMLSTFDEKEMRLLAKADVKHMDAMNNLLTSGLKQLSRSNSKWCRASYYESMSNVDPMLALSDLSRALGYGSEFYDWSLDFSMIVLTALEDARVNPKSYSGLTQSDEAVLQRAMMGVIANPQIMKLAMLQNASPAEAERALANVNICDLALSFEGVYNGLPKGTRERLWGEMAKEIDAGGVGSSLGGFVSF